MSASEKISKVPTLDLSGADAGAAERAAFLSDLRNAARDVGFFYLVGHGIDDGQLDQIRKLARDFFALPTGDKLAIEMVNSPHFRGYNRAGFEHTRGKPDWREQLDVGAERAAFLSDRSAPAWTRLQGPNRWPAGLPELKAALLAYQEKTTALAIRLLRAFAVALDQPDEAFASIYSPEPHQ